MPATDQSRPFPPVLALRSAIYPALWVGLFWALSLPAATELSPQTVELRLKSYVGITGFRARFTQVKHLKDMALDLTSEGQLTVIRPHKVIWRVDRPSPLEMTLEERAIHLVQGQGAARREQHWKLGNEIGEADLKGIHDLMAWLRLDIPAINAAYRLTEVKPGELRCAPRENSPHSPFVAMNLRLNPKGHLERLILEERSGDSLEITFSAPEKVTEGK